MTKKYLIFDPFILQAVISNIPSVIVMGLIPVLGIKMGLSLIEIGIFFLLVRFGSVIGSFFSPRLLAKWPPHVVGSTAEYSTGFLSLIILFAACQDIAAIFVIAGFFKGCLSGTITVVRFSWLRRLPEFQHSSQLNLIINTVAQGGYAAIGILLLLTPSETLTTTLFLTDAITSIIGAQLFWNMRKHGIKAQPENIICFTNMIKTSVNSQKKRTMLLASLLLYAAMGGGNILLLKYGIQLFGEQQGYAIALTLYGLFFLCGGQLIRRLNVNKNGIVFHRPMTLISLVMMIASIALLPLFPIRIVQIILFSSIFFFYALVLLQVQSEWFHLSGPEESSLMGAAQIFYSQVLFGLGEWGYSLLLSDYIVRAVLLLLSGGVFFLYSLENMLKSFKQ